MSERSRTILVLGLLGIVIVRSIREVGNHKMTTWSFDYEFGFVRRGLAGELLGGIFGPTTSALLTVASLLLLVAVVTVLVVIFALPLRQQRDRIGAWLFVVVASTHSATIPHYAYDLGRFDQVGTLVVVACLAVMVKARATIQVLAIAGLSVVGMLVHEAFFLLFLPLIGAIWLDERSTVNRMIKVAVGVAMAAVVLFLGLYAGQTIRLEDYVAHLSARHDFPISTWATSMLYRGTGENIAATVEWLRQPEILWQQAVLLITLLPTIGLLSVAGRAMLRGDGRDSGRLLIIGAALAPLAMYPLALDVFRWVAIAITNLFIALAYLAFRDGSSDRLATAMERVSVLVLLVIALSLALGPIGIEDSTYALFDGIWYLPNGGVWP